MLEYINYHFYVILNVLHNFPFVYSSTKVLQIPFKCVPSNSIFSERIQTVLRFTFFLTFLKIVVILVCDCVNEFKKTRKNLIS